MFEFISGKIIDLQPTAAVMATAGGVGYIINISLNTYSALEGKEEATLLVHLVVREDAWTLYGFADERERTLFRLLIGVSGVGAATARVVLSSYTAVELESIISSGDVKALKNVKGIGSKTAERIMVDLKDKIASDALIENVATVAKSPMQVQAFDEALAALVMLGFTRVQSQKVLKKIFDDNPTTTLETAIKKALSML